MTTCGGGVGVYMQLFSCFYFVYLSELEGLLESVHFAIVSAQFSLAAALECPAVPSRCRQALAGPASAIMMHRVLPQRGIAILGVCVCSSVAGEQVAHALMNGPM